MTTLRSSLRMTGIAAAAVVLALATGCGAAPAGEEDTGGTTDELARVGTERPEPCVYAAGGAWGGSDFENQLIAFGCLAPKPVGEGVSSDGSPAWWQVSKCPSNLAVKNFVA